MAYNSPSDPKSVPERPLNKGMLLHIPSNSIEPGGMIEVRDMNVQPQGLIKRSGTGPYSSASVDYGDVQGVVSYWETDGDQVTFAMDEKFMYQVGKATLAGVYSTYSTGTVSGSSGGNTITGTSTVWATNNLRAGDIIVIDDGGANEEIHEISAINNDTEIIIDGTLANAHSGVNYEIRRAFAYPEPYFLDWTNNGQRLIFADFNRSLWSYDDINGLTQFDTDDNYRPGCVAYFNDRIFIGRTIESGDTKRQRIRWSGVGFSNHNSFPAENFIELPYSRGILLRLVPFSNFLVAYFTDAIYMGRGTNNANLPVSFQRVETGGVGLVGMRAVASYLDGHFFVGQDDVYFLSNRGFERIGTPIVKDMLTNVNDKWNIRAAVDPKHDRVVFAVPYGGSSLNRLYAYNYKSKAWSWMDIEVTSLDNIGLIATTTWDDLTDTGVLSTDAWDTGFGSTYPTWESLASSAIPERSLYFGNVGQVWYDIPGSSDDNGSSIITRFTTRDMDENAPDINKLWTRITLKLEEPVSQDITFTLEGSIDRGNTWKSLGTISIETGDDEGHVNFRLSGQLARFRFTGDGNTEPNVTIVEIVRRVSAKGLETPGRSTG